MGITIPGYSTDPEFGADPFCPLCGPLKNSRTWAVSTLPYLELGNDYNAFNTVLPVLARANSTTMRTKVGVFLCPSDGYSDQEPGRKYQRVKGNMASNWGNTHYYQDEPGYPGIGPNPFPGPAGVSTFTGAPFKLNAANSLAAFTDGSSGTLLLGEVIIGINQVVTPTVEETESAFKAWDRRGDLLVDDFNGSMFNTYTTPNSGVPDANGLEVYCGYGYANNPPCTADYPSFNASRSRHRGGVNALFADGSVHFIRDGVARGVWQALGSPAAGDLVSGDAY